MTRDDIIRMAREAGFVDHGVPAIKVAIIERFAALVAASERQACARQLDQLGCDHCAAALRALRAQIAAVLDPSSEEAHR